MTDFLLVLVAIIWGVNFSVVKFGTQQMPAIAYNGIRITIATLILGVIALAMRDQRPSRRDTIALLALGVIGNGLYQVLFIEGIARTRAGTAALVLASGPAFIALLGRLRGTEHVSRRGWAGIGLQLLGMMSVVVGGASAASGENSLAGNLMVLAGSVCWAFFATSLRPYTHRVHPIHLSAITMAGGALVVGALAAPVVRSLPPSVYSIQLIAAILFSSVLALVVAYLWYYRGVRVLGPTRTAMYSNLQPLIALIVAWIMLREAPTGWQIAGAASIMSGLILSRL
jgi:drug/metabolite transporter (DMT)-like permease